jgi:hypothetical protein
MSYYDDYVDVAQASNSTGGILSTKDTTGLAHQGWDYML